VDEIVDHLVLRGLNEEAGVVSQWVGWNPRVTSACVRIRKVEECLTQLTESSSCYRVPLGDNPARKYIPTACPDGKFGT